MQEREARVALAGPRPSLSLLESQQGKEALKTSPRIYLTGEPGPT